MSKMSKLIATMALAGSLILPAAAFAQTPTPTPTPKAMFRPKLMRAASGTLASIISKLTKPHPNVKISLKKTVASSTKASTVTGTFQSLSGTSITLSGPSSTTYTVDASSAKVLRKYGATMQLSDIQSGDSLTVTGTVSGTSVTAKTVRDMSQQQKNASFSGSVSSVSGSSFVLATKQRGSQTINTTSSTTFKESGQTGVGINNVTEGENVTTSGVWDSTASTVEASTVTIVVKTGSTYGIFQSTNGEIISMTAKTSSSTAYSVDATNAKLIRRYGAAMQLSDMQAGDELLVSGTINALNITAKTIRDESLQAHNGTFVGTVSGLLSSGFTLQSKNRGSQTINTASTTVFKIGSQTGSLSSIAVGQTVTVSGVWDRTNTNVTASRVTIKVTSSTITGALSSISGTTLTVTNASSTIYTIDAGKAVFTYKNGRRGTISLLEQNDQVTVRGQMISGSTNMTATSVRDLSQTYTKPTPTPTPMPTATPTPSPTDTPTPTNTPTPTPS